jgi:hypothetical protein
MLMFVEKFVGSRSYLVRVILVKKNVWFVAADLADILGLPSGRALVNNTQVRPFAAQMPALGSEKPLWLVQPQGLEMALLRHMQWAQRSAQRLPFACYDVNPPFLTEMAAITKRLLAWSDRVARKYIRLMARQVASAQASQASIVLPVSKEVARIWNREVPSNVQAALCETFQQAVLEEGRKASTQAGQSVRKMLRELLDLAV